MSKPSGRPTKFTASRGAIIVRAKAEGETHAVAAVRAGVPLRTVRRWLREGEGGREPFAAFAKAFHRAEDAARRKLVAAAARAMDGALDAA